MGLNKTQGTNYDLERLMSGIEKGRIVLPEFQRSFVWDPKAVKQLLATCITGWPIGSLLVVPATDDLFFEVREIETAPKPTQPQLVILDGQQRLTSLYQALSGTGLFVYSVGVDILDSTGSIDELETAIYADRSATWARKFNTPVKQWQHRRIPIASLRTATAFYAWRDAAIPATDGVMREELTSLYVTKLSGLDRFEIPAVVIDDEVHPEAIARIFERVNRLGQPLKTFDLMVARSYAQGFNLRDKWSVAQRDFPQVARFLDEDGLPVLTAMALALRGSVRQQDVINLTGDQVRENWAKSVVAIQAATDYLTEMLGCWDGAWLPYKVQLSVLAALFFEDSAVNRDSNLRAWFWRSIVESRYDVASNTRAVEDYKALKSGEYQPARSLTLDLEVFSTMTRRQYGALHRGVLCLLATGHPLDIDTGEVIQPGDPRLVVRSVMDPESPVEGAEELTAGMVLSLTKLGPIDVDSAPSDRLLPQGLPLDAARLHGAEFIRRRVFGLAEKLSDVLSVPVRAEILLDE
jgi:hypothetical protein